MVRFIGQLLAIVLAFFIFFVWRIQKDNDSYQKKEQNEEKARLADEAPNTFEEPVTDKPVEDKDKEQPVLDSASMWA